MYSITSSLRPIWILEWFPFVVTMCVVVDVQTIKELVHRLRKSGSFLNLLTTSQSKSIRDRFTKNLQLDDGMLLFRISISQTRSNDAMCS